MKEIEAKLREMKEIEPNADHSTHNYRTTKKCAIAITCQKSPFVCEDFYHQSIWLMCSIVHKHWEPPEHVCIRCLQLGGLKLMCMVSQTYTIPYNLAWRHTFCWRWWIFLDLRVFIYRISINVRPLAMFIVSSSQLSRIIRVACRCWKYSPNRGHWIDKLFTGHCFIYFTSDSSGPKLTYFWSLLFCITSIDGT